MAIFPVANRSAHLVQTNNPSWPDMSDYVVHFAKQYDGRSDYDTIMGILSGQVIRAFNIFGIARENAPDPSSQRTVCFSETPLHYLGRIANRRSELGIVFRKSFIVSRGGNPILYAYRDQPLYRSVHALMAAGRGNPNAPIWSMTPFVDAVGGNYNFEWEREWRHIGDLRFTSDDVAFLIIPANLHEAARTFFASAEEDEVGPNYPCPFIDARWNQQQIAEALG